MCGEIYDAALVGACGEVGLLEVEEELGFGFVVV